MARVKTHFFNEINRPEEDHQYEYEEYLSQNLSYSSSTKPKPETEKCDMCGDEIKGKSFPVTDENFNKQPGLKQCEFCRFKTHKNHKKPLPF